MLKFTELRQLWTRGALFTGLGGPCATGAEAKTIGFAPGGVGGSEKEDYMDIVKSIIVAVVETVGFIIAVIGITIFGIAFS